MTTEMEETDARVYEVGYLLIPSLKEEEVSVAYSNLKDLLSSLGGQIISDEMPTMLNLAYPITKVVKNVSQGYQTAYFGWLKFFIDPKQMPELKKKFDLEANILRFLMIKTVKENTIAAKRFLKDSTRRRSPILNRGGELKEEITTIDKEKIDKEIEAMVAE